MLRFIFKLNVALHAAKAATFGSKILPTWRERYLHQYALMSLQRPYSYFMLTGQDNHDKWFPSGRSLLATTGVIQWSNSTSYKLPEKPKSNPLKNPESRFSFKHPNQIDLLMNYHSEDKDSRSQEEVYAHFEDLKNKNQLHVCELDLGEDEKYEEKIVIHKGEVADVELGIIQPPESAGQSEVDSGSDKNA